MGTEWTRPDGDLIRSLSAFTTATIHEAQGRLGALDSCIKPIDRGMKLCGPAFTVRCAPRDNLMLQLAIAVAGPGDVLVVSTGGYGEAGYFGDVLAHACSAKGIGGLIIDSGVRDTMELRALGFPVFSSAISIKGTVKETPYPLNEPVVIGGELVRPGDAVCGDVDGVVVVAQERIQSTAGRCQSRVEVEARLIDAYLSGRTVIELCGLEAIFGAKGFCIDRGRGLGPGFKPSETSLAGAASPTPDESPS